MLLVWASVTVAAGQAEQQAPFPLQLPANTLYNIYNKHGNAVHNLTAQIYFELSGIVQRSALLAWKEKENKNSPTSSWQ